MNDQKFAELMQLAPAQYVEEAAAFRAAHGTAARAEITQSSGISGRMLRAALPVGAAACAAAVIGLVGWIAQGRDPGNVESHQQEITEQFAATTLPADETQTDTDSTLTTTAAQTALPADETPALTVGATGSGKPASGTKSAGTKTNSAAKNTAAALTPAEAKQTETTAAPLPYDPEIVAKYQKGDVDMNGEIDLYDMNLLLREYTTVVLKGGESSLTPEQIYLGDITDEWDPSVVLGESEYNTEIVETDYPISAADAMILLAYYTEVYMAGYNQYADIPADVFAQFGHTPFIDENGSYVTNHYGGRLTDSTDLTDFSLPDIGRIQVRYSGVSDWTLSDYSYERWNGLLAMTYGDPYSDESYITIDAQYMPRSTSRSDIFQNRLAETPEQYGVLPIEGRTVWYQKRPVWGELIGHDPITGRAQYELLGYEDNWEQELVLSWYEGDMFVQCYVENPEIHSIDYAIEMAELFQYIGNM